MSPAASWLIDKSAYARLGTSPDAEIWAERITRGLVQITTMTLLEVGFSAQTADDWSRAVEGPPASHMPITHVTPAIESRAVEIQGMLTRSGHHRAPSIPDLLIAAAAEISRLSLLHLDKGFDLIAAVTGQPVERLRVG
jgi:predicted nucleic acid-binding protein